METIRSKTLTFSIGEVAKFLDRSVFWIREQERLGRFRTASKKYIIPDRTETPSGRGQRRYTLKHIQAMAESMHRDGISTDGELARTMRKVRAFSE